MPTEQVLTALVNDLAAAPSDVWLVLDDYHLVDDHDVGQGMDFLLQHLPPQVHLVLSTRADPDLPLARWRARGELVEIRAADLRFTAEEATAYLNEATGLGLSAADVAAVEERTEGWIAALQLAALSLRGRDDVTGFIAQFAGNDRYLVDCPSRRSWRTSLRPCASSCCARHSSTGSPGRSATPSSAVTTARSCS
ncbi:hypothetical protein [Cellulomonas sp. WB94]|uniref:hypothetical protein n=1 Tax=Cellulomonas sp. WB94 TaxID=2173174 RepID=UPI001F5BAF09|nr:hypothetical protein [Cellulomonas sp. WB94]